MPEVTFKVVYHQNVDLVYNLCLHYLQNQEEAEEVTQDVFLKVHLNQHKFKGQSNFNTWIYRITINKCLDYIRSKKTQKKQFFTNNFYSIDKGNLQIAEKGHPGIALEHKESYDKLFNCINQLKPKQKNIIILKYIEDLSNKEIGNILKLSEKAVESRLARARKNLEKILNQNEG